MNYIGYHGTDAQYEDSIKQNGFNFSGDKEWFGAGIYFFETLLSITDGHNEAKNWCQKIKNYKSWVIFKVKITSQTCIDLIGNQNHKEKFEKMRSNLLLRHIRQGLNTNDFTDRVVFQYMEDQIIKLGEEIDAIRALVDARRNNDYTSYVVRQAQVQICVKKSEIIVENEVISTGSC